MSSQQVSTDSLHVNRKTKSSVQSPIHSNMLKGFDDALKSLDQLKSICFNLPVDQSIRYSEKIKDLFWPTTFNSILSSNQVHNWTINQ